MQSVMTMVKAVHRNFEQHTFVSKFSVLSLMTELIAEMLLMLFLICNL